MATKASQLTKQPIMNAVHFVLQGKGGVGKSLFSAFLAQFLQDKVEVVNCFDTDPVNQTLKNYQALNAEHINLMQGSKIDERNFDVLMERLLSEEGIFVIDNGASSFVPLSNYLIENHAIKMLQDTGKNVFIHCVITGGQALLDTLAGFKALAEQTDSSKIVIWLNEYFGAITHNGKSFNEMRVYLDHADKVRGVVRMVKRNQDTFGKDIEEMITRKLTFTEAIQSAEFSLMAKQRIKTVQREIFDQLNVIGF